MFILAGVSVAVLMLIGARLDYTSRLNARLIETRETVNFAVVLREQRPALSFHPDDDFLIATHPLGPDVVRIRVSNLSSDEHNVPITEAIGPYLLVEVFRHRDEPALRAVSTRSDLLQ